MTSGGWKSCFHGTLTVCLCLQIIISSGVAQGEVGFDYSTGPNGPAYWGDLNAIWATCKTGMYQSPMLITPDIMVADPLLGDLDALYSSTPVAANVSHEGFTVQVKVSPDSGVLNVGGVQYLPQQFHFHMGSEHKIPVDTIFPVMELHLVHSSEVDPNVKAVIAWLFVQGNDSSFLAQFDGMLPMPDSNTSAVLPSIMLPTLETSYARYDGSLTTPPCSENVKGPSYSGISLQSQSARFSCSRLPCR